MALNLDELIRHAKDYVQLEAKAAVLSAVHHETLTLFGRQDVVLSVTIDDPSDPEWWVIGGSTPMNLYTKRRFPSADEAFSFHQGLMLRMLDRQASRSDGAPERIGYDAFICHASEDKESLVRPLAENLVERGFDIWYDEFELTVGDSLRQSIDRGLASSRFGIVILSQAFLGKNWPQYELNGLTAREIDGEKVILPVWHGITKNDVLHYSPSLADKVAICTGNRPLDTVGLRRNGNLLRPAINESAEIHLFGQEVNPETWAVSKSDLFMKDPTGRDADNIAYGSTLSNDRHADRTFDYLIANPPYGKDWKRDQDAVRAEHERGAAGRFGPGLPRISDGQLLFLLHMLGRTKDPKEGGSRIAIIMNGSPLFTEHAAAHTRTR